MLLCLSRVLHFVARGQPQPKRFTNRVRLNVEGLEERVVLSAVRLPVPHAEPDFRKAAKPKPGPIDVLLTGLGPRCDKSRRIAAKDNDKTFKLPADGQAGSILQFGGKAIVTSKTVIIQSFSPGAEPFSILRDGSDNGGSHFGENPDRVRKLHGRLTSIFSFCTNPNQAVHLFADWIADQGVDDRTGIVIPADLPVGAEGQFPPIRVPLFQDRERSLYANGGSFKIFRVSKTNQQYIIIFDNPSLTVDGFEQVIPRDGSTGANVTLVSTTANPRLDAQIRERACESHGALPRMDNPFGGCVPDTAFVEAELGLRPGSSGLLA